MGFQKTGKQVGSDNDKDGRAEEKENRSERIAPAMLVKGISHER
jgi:hypothetical protein